MNQKRWLAILLAAALVIPTLSKPGITAFATETGTDVKESAVDGISNKEETDDANPANPDGEAAAGGPSSTGGEIADPKDMDLNGEIVNPDDPDGKTVNSDDTGAKDDILNSNSGIVDADGASLNDETVDSKKEDVNDSTKEQPGEIQGINSAENSGNGDGNETTDTDPSTSGGEAENQNENDVLLSNDIEETESNLLSDENVDDGISPMSLFPYREVEVSVYLNDYTKEQLAVMPVDRLLELLVDEDGNKINIPADAEILCGYQKGEDGYPLSEDSFQKIERGGTVDLSYAWEEYTSYEMQLIIGEANQLAPDNTRYIVTVYINLIQERLNYEIYKESSYGSRSQVYDKEIISKDTSVLGEIGMPVTEVSYYVSGASSFQAGGECYLNIESSLAADVNRDIDVKIYPMKTFLDNYQKGSGLTGELTDILNQQDMYQSGGHKGRYTALNETDPLSSDNVFCIVYSEASGRIIGYRGLIFMIRSGEPVVPTGNIYACEGGQMKKAAELTSSHLNGGSNGAEWKVDKNGAVVVDYVEWWNQYDLLEGYNSKSDYYYVMDANDQIGKIVEGQYNTREEAESKGAEDVTAQLLPGDQSAKPYGYKMKAGYGSSFTVFFKDGSGLKLSIYLSDAEEEVYSYNADFQMQSAKGYERNVYSITYEDSYYRNGYQTILINDAEADLKNLVPIFYQAEGSNVYDSRNSAQQQSGVTPRDFSAGPLEYGVVLKGKQPKNYVVTFVKKEKEARLFVNGPAEREIFLTGAYNYEYHDIVLANVGEKELTGLKAELLNPSHVKLDDYWNVGGEGNHTLPPFTTVESRDPDGNWAAYGELFNLAKLRLLPDGEGLISGTLKISADGQKDVYIKLKGVAGNPKIITESLREGVKYVPYAALIATNNMYEWNEMTFSIARGALPEGLSLDAASGEIYGAPKEFGEFPITVRVSHSRPEFRASTASYTLVIKENTDDNVYAASDSGYEPTGHVGRQRSDTEFGTYHYVLSKKGDQTFVSYGPFDECQGFWLNGEKLTEGVDYTKESGSTRITIRSQTFENKANQNGSNTIAAEFRVNNDPKNDLKVSAQNFVISYKKGGGGSGSGSSADGGEGADAGGASSGADVSASHLATLVMRMVDPAGNPLSGMTVELHSTPKATQTNSNGIAVFVGVESGQHTLYLKDANGNLLASKAFELLFGGTTQINGNQIMVKAGTASTLNIQRNGEELIFLNLLSGDIYQVLPANTNDTSNPELWLLLSLVSSLAIAGGCLYGRKKKKTNRE